MPRKRVKDLDLLVSGYLVGPEQSNPSTGPVWVRTLPLSPIWPGFAVNTAFYAAPLWLLFAVMPRAVRRHLRRRRGRCLKCGYDLRGDLAGGCPECGWNRADVTM